MQDPNPTHSPENRPEPSPGDANVERLLQSAYRPETPDADFAARLEA